MTKKISSLDLLLTSTLIDLFNSTPKHDLKVEDEFGLIAYGSDVDWDEWVFADVWLFNDCKGTQRPVEGEFAFPKQALIDAFKFRKEINSLPLAGLQIERRGYVSEVTKEIADDLAYSGLSTFD